MAFDLNTLIAKLGETGQDYLSLSDLPDSWVKVQFIGRFAGREVAWDATFQTLRRYHQEQAVDKPVRAYMEIALLAGDACHIEVGLDLLEIDEPAIRKIIIMVRNYKRLKVGRMEWGEVISDFAAKRERV